MAARLKTYTTSWDAALEAFDRVLGAIRLFKGIAHTETSILLSTHKL